MEKIDKLNCDGALKIPDYVIPSVYCEGNSVQEQICYMFGYIKNLEARVKHLEGVIKREQSL